EFPLLVQWIKNWNEHVIITSGTSDTLLPEKQHRLHRILWPKKDDYKYCMSEYLRMSGIYWSLTIMDLMGQLHSMNGEEILAFIKSGQREGDGISAIIGHDPQLLYILVEVPRCELFMVDAGFLKDAWKSSLD
uniref:Uncharacterized protein n=1 Tax=Catagonus wagneri TaxID=51154 RepID=A0A8C3YWJ5_9CETA